MATQSQFEQGMRRLDDRVRRWPATRWEGAGASGRARSEVAYELALTLALLARRAGNGAPPVTPPRVAPHGIADQLMVLGLEFAAAAESAALWEEATDAVQRAVNEL